MSIRAIVIMAEWSSMLDWHTAPIDRACAHIFPCMNDAVSHAGAAGLPCIRIDTSFENPPITANSFSALSNATRISLGGVGGPCNFFVALRWWRLNPKSSLLVYSIPAVRMCYTENTSQG